MNSVNMEQPEVSIVITAYNEEKDIPNLLNSLMKINYPKNKLEIIVVDDGSTDNTRKILMKYKNIKTIKGPHKGMGNARNLGWRNSKGNIIIFIDADMVLHKNYVKEIVKKFQEDEDIDSVEGNEKLYNKSKFIAEMLHLRHELGWSQAKKRIPRAIKKYVLEKLNGVDHNYGYYVDWELFYRMCKSGYRIEYAPKAILWHKQIEDWEELAKQGRWMGRSMIFSLAKHKLETIKKIGFTLLLTFLPLYIFLLLFPMPLRFFGIISFSVFLFVEFKRTIKMFLITKKLKSFITPIFDFISMSFVFLGMLDKIFNIKLRKVKGRI